MIISKWIIIERINLFKEGTGISISEIESKVWCYYDFFITSIKLAL